MTLPRIILAATDFSEHADHALDYAVELAAQLGARVHLVHAISIPPIGLPEATVVDGVPLIERVTAEAEEALEVRAARYRDRTELDVHLDVGDPREVVDQIAKRIGADLIVMGTHGRRGVKRVLLGSVAEAIVRTAPCPVLTIRPKRG
jgi:nucleotide-binding universal stress UspA family protein